MASAKYQIGDQVWWACFETERDYVTCPDCGGTGQITCLLFDATQVSVDCAGCTNGYLGPQGRLKVYARKPTARLRTITRMEIDAGKIEYGVTDGYRVVEEDLFQNESDALERAAEKAAAAEAEERDRIARKEKDTRSWSWNVHYHRRAIRDAEKQIAYHTSKLNVAKLKAKEPA